MKGGDKVARLDAADADAAPCSSTPRTVTTTRRPCSARERKKRIEAADAYRDAGRAEQAEAEQAEAEMIAAYLPEQISDEELEAIVDEAVSSSGAESVKDMGRVMGAVMPKVKGRADGNRVSAAVRAKRLGA